MRALLVSMLLAAVACGGSGDSSTPGDGPPTDGTPGGGTTTGSLCDGTATVTGCQMAWTGAATGHAECHPSYDPGAAGATTGLSMSTWTSPTGYANLYFAQPLTVGTYVLDDLQSARGGLLPSVSSDPNYLMRKDDTGTSGTLSLTIASFDGSGNPHGHLRLVAPEIHQISATVEVCAQF